MRRPELILLAATLVAIVLIFSDRREHLTEAQQKAWRAWVIGAKYPHWGWGANNSLRCKYNNNTGCDTMWSNGELIERPAPAAPAAPAAQPAAPTTSAPVVYYQNTNRGGATTTEFNEMNKLYGNLGKTWNDKISAIEVPPGKAVHAYQKTHAGGKSIVFGPGYHDLTQYDFHTNAKKNVNACNDLPGLTKNTDCWNDSISSLEVRAA